MSGRRCAAAARRSPARWPRRAPRSPRPGRASPGRCSSARATASRCCSPPLSCRLQFCDLVQPPDEVAQPDRRAAPRGSPSSSKVAGCGRVGDGVAQRADRDVRPLRQEQHARVGAARGSAPCPNGQIPARARKSVLLPLPVGPVISTRSPGSIVESVPSDRIVRPSGSASSRSSARTPPRAVGARPRCRASLGARRWPLQRVAGRSAGGRRWPSSWPARRSFRRTRRASPAPGRRRWRSGSARPGVIAPEK